MATADTKRDGASTTGAEEIGSRSKEVKWYNPELTNIPEAIQEVFEKYSKIPPERVHDHIYKVRERAWDVWPFPCIGGWRFLTLIQHSMPQYPEIVKRLTDGEKYLDLGCGLGQEMRRLIYDGVPSENLYGTDLRPEFLDMGYELFVDRETCHSTFIAADAFSENSALSQLNGTISIIFAGAFFHLFGRKKQLDIARLVTRLLKPTAGSMVLGRQVGSVKPGLYEHGTNPDSNMFRHDGQTWQELWDEVGAETGVRWHVETTLTLVPVADRGLADENLRMLKFCVRRL